MAHKPSFTTALASKYKVTLLTRACEHAKLKIKTSDEAHQGTLIHPLRLRGSPSHVTHQRQHSTNAYPRVPQTTAKIILAHSLLKSILRLNSILADRCPQARLAFSLKPLTPTKSRTEGKTMTLRDNRYDIVLADTEESKDIHFKLRYQVYCLEKGFEEAQKFADNLEKDEYDEKAAHFLIRCHATQSWIGTFRIVLDKFHRLPLNDHATVQPEHIPTHEQLCAEFSRLAVLRTFQEPKSGAITNVQLDCHILMRAINSGVRYAQQAGAAEIAFFCQRSLGKVVDKIGISMQRIGPGSHHRGLRFPFMTRLGNFPQNTFKSEISLQSHKQHSVFFRYSDYLAPQEMAA